jgi:hypothetical protein
MSYAGSEETLQAINTETYKFRQHESENNTPGSEKEMKTKKISRRTRGRNIVQMVHSDHDEEVHSVASDNPHLYTRSRSSVRYFWYNNLLNHFFPQNTLDNTSTKKYLLQSRGKNFVKVESKMKTIEKSLSKTTKNEQMISIPVRNETKDMSDMVYNLKNEIMMKEQLISK